MSGEWFKIGQNGYNIISVLLMLPYISTQQTKKKPTITPSDQALKQWSTIKKQLQSKSKAISSKMPSAAMADFYKICRLKQIPQFYCSYLLLSIEKLTQERIVEVLGTEVRDVINHRSHYHRIMDAVDARVEVIKDVELQLEICEGFQDMNAGKTIKPANRTKINQLLKQATSLQQIKQIQHNSISTLTTSLSNLRKNTSKIFQQVQAWRQTLHKISCKKPKLKIIFPYLGFNCVLLPLFDQASILGSFLAREFYISGENNPFVLIGKDGKRKSQFQGLFRDCMGKDGEQYEGMTQEILAEYPYKEDPLKKQKEIQAQLKQKEQQKIKWLKQMKQRSKIDEKTQQKKPQNTSNKQPKQTKQPKQIKQTKQRSLKKKAKSLIDIESILLKHKQNRKKKEESKLDEKGEDKSLEQKPVQPSPKKNDTTIMNIYGVAKQKPNSDEKIKEIMNEKNRLQQQLKQANKKNKQFEKLIKKIQKTQSPKKALNNIKPPQMDQKKSIIAIEQVEQSQNKSQFQNKIEAVYKSRHSKKINNKKDRNLDNSQLNVEDLLNDKLSLEKQLKEQLRQRKSMEKLLKKSELEMNKKLESSLLEKSNLQQKISLLQSRVQQKQKETNEEEKLQKSKASIVSVYMNEKLLDDSKATIPVTNLYESKLMEEKQKRLSLQKQMKDVMKQRAKLEKTLQKSQLTMMKQKEVLDKKMQKYEETIQKLKLEHSELKIKKQNFDLMERKKSESLRMYTTTPVQNQPELKKQHSVKKLTTHIQSANYFKLPPEVKKPDLKQKIITEKDEQHNEDDKKIISTRNLNKVEIIQTKKTIQIIYESNRRSKKKKNQSQPPQKESIVSVNNQELEKVKKEKQSLMFQLEREEAKRLREEKASERKALKQESQTQRYKEIIAKERQKKFELENKIKSLKRELYDQFEERLKSQKLKFQQEKRELLAMVESEKGEKQLKQKYLNNQIKFLKQMQSNQNQLLKLLQLQKRNRLQKQKQLAAEIAKKQQLLQIIELQEIKKGIESEIRNQLENQQQEDQSEGVDFEEKKDQLRLEIQEMTEERNLELEEIDQQNQKLKELIARIKNQENKIVEAIHENIKQQDQHLSEAHSRLKTEQLLDGRSNELNIVSNQKIDQNSDIELNNLDRSKVSQVSDKKSPNIDIQQTQKIFQSRLKNQQNHQLRMHNQFKKIRESPQYKGKQQVQNIIEMYLQNPHQYPPTKKIQYSPEEKKQIEAEVINKSKMAINFQKELLELKQIQKFVPTAQDDIMTSHLLNLKKVYEEKQSSALKQELFPSIRHDQNYHDEELSFQSETPPPKTIRDHVELHAKNFPVKKDNSKNFLSINRMRVAMLEQNRRQKQKQLIEQQAKKRAKAEVLKRVLRAKQQQHQRKSLQKKRKLEQLQQKQAKADKKNKKKSHSKTKNSEDEQIKQNTISSWGNKSKITHKLPINSHDDSQIQKEPHQNDEYQNKNQNQNQDIKEVSENNQKQPDQNQQQGQQFNTENLEVTNQHSSLDREKKELQDDIYRYQDEIRSFVSRQQRYDIYQQFVDSSQIDSYINNIISISSQQIKGLNNNKTISKDIPGYTSVLILIAKDKSKQVQVGIGIFHKQFQDGLYVCDYVMAHNMRNFLNLIFNFSRYMFNIDEFTNKIQFFFDVNKLEDQISVIHFIQFEEKCKRMGEVYVRVGSDKTRKYALRRNLFEPTDKEFKSEGLGLQFDVSLEIHSDPIKQRGVGFKNTKNIQYFSTTALLSLYLKKNQQVLGVFRKNSEDDLKYRQLLLTALMFQKKQIALKNCESRQLQIQQRVQISKNLYQAFNIEDPAHAVSQLKFHIEQPLPQKTKRCTFQIEEEQINYIITFPEEAITKIQSSNSSQTGIFLNVLPKNKLFIIEAGEFLSMCKVNPEINTFFYIKHFIKNIVDVGKQEHTRVFLPEVVFENEVFLKDLSDSMKLGIFGREKVKFGWSNRFSNSIVFSPTHKDLVIKKPFIISIMSAVVERAIEGTPLCATLVQ